MDESETFSSVEKDDSIEMEIDTEKSNQLKIQEDVTSTEDQETDARPFVVKIKHVCKEGNELPDDQQEKDKDSSLLQRTVQVTPEEKTVAQQDTINLDNSSTKKNKYLESIVSKYRSAKTNANVIIKRIKFIRRQRNVGNETSFRSKQHKVFIKKKKYILQAEKGIEISKETGKFQTELQDSKDSMPRGVVSKNTKPEAVVLRRFVKNPSFIRKSQSMMATSAESKDMTKICSVRPTSVPKISCISAAASESPKGKSPGEVLAHFRRYMKSKKESFDRVTTGNVSEENMEIEENRDLKDPNKATTDSTSQYDCSVRPTSVPKISSMSSAASESSKVKSPGEVLAHFRRYMKSDKESFDRVMTGNISVENMEIEENRDLKDPNRATTDSASQDSKDRTKTVMESAITQESRKVASDVAATLGDNLTAAIRNTSSKPRQRTVHHETAECMRKWVIQQIKDKEVVLKFRLMEGKYSNDVETKMSCIEKAKNIQSQIDILFDTLDDHDKLESIPIQSKDFWGSTEETDLPESPTKSIEDLLASPTKSIEDLLASPTKSNEDLLASPTENIEDLEYPERYINSFGKLLKHLYKSSESENENVLKTINPRKFISEYNRYVLSKKKRDDERENLKYTAISVVQDFYLSLEQCRLRVKCKIPRPEIRTLEDCQNYISDLRTAVAENLECLYTIIPLATSVIFPLMSYLSQSRIKVVDILSFLNQERPHVFSESSNKNEAFFEKFCHRHFKH